MEQEVLPFLCIFKSAVALYQRPFFLVPYHDMDHLDKLKQLTSRDTHFVYPEQIVSPWVRYGAKQADDQVLT
jgi:hypothetical protein